MKRLWLLLCILTGGFGVWADDPYAGCPDIIRNGSFEEGLDAKGAPKHWRINVDKGERGFVKLTEEHATDGKYAVHISKQGMIGSVGLTQSVRLKPNTEYVMQLKGVRKAGNRWHYFGVRMPDSKVRAEAKIPVDGRPVPPLRIRSDPVKTLCYVNIYLWGRNDHNKATIGDMWVDQVTLRELPQISRRLINVPFYAFADDTLDAKLFIGTYRGEATLSVTDAKGRQVATKKIEVKPGEQAFTIGFAGASAGMAELRLTSADHTLDLSHSFIIQEKGF